MFYEGNAYESVRCNIFSPWRTQEGPSLQLSWLETQKHLMEEWQMLLIRVVQHKQESRGSLQTLRSGTLLEIKGEHSILNQTCKGPPFLNSTYGSVFCPAAVMLYRRVWVSPPHPTPAFLKIHNERNLIDGFIGGSDPTLFSLSLCVLGELMIITGLSPAPLIHQKFVMYYLH